MMRPKSSAENPSVDEEEDFITEKKKKRRKVPQIKRPPTVMKVKEVLAVPEPPAVREPQEVKEVVSDDSVELNEKVGEDPWRGARCEAGGCEKKNCVRCEYCQLHYHEGEHGHFTCEATTNCDLCFPSKQQRDLHFKTSHSFLDML